MTSTASQRAPKAKVSISSISAEECSRLRSEWEAKLKRPRSELFRRMEVLEVAGDGIRLTGPSLASLKASVSKFSKATGKKFKVFLVDDNQVVIVRLA